PATVFPQHLGSVARRGWLLPPRRVAPRLSRRRCAGRTRTRPERRRRATRRVDSIGWRPGASRKPLRILPTFQTLLTLPSLPRGRRRRVSNNRDLPPSRLAHQRELVDALRLRLAVARDGEIGADVGELIAVDGDGDVRDRLAEGDGIRILL